MGKDVANALVVEKVVIGYLRTVESDEGNEFGLDWAREVICFIFIHASKDISDKRERFSCFNRRRFCSIERAFHNKDGQFYKNCSVYFCDVVADFAEKDFWANIWVFFEAKIMDDL